MDRGAIMFDPTQPYEVVGGFDPSKPFEEVEPQVDERGFRIIEGKGMPPIRDVPEFAGASRFGGALGLPAPEGTNAYINRLADYYDVSQEGAGADILAKGSLTLERPDDYQRLLSEEYGQDVSVYMHPELGEPVFKHPETGKETFVRSPTSLAQWGASVVGDVPTLAAEVAGGVGGMPAGAIGVGLGAGGGGFLGEVARLDAGKLAGFNDYSQGTIFGEALVHGLITMGAGVAGEAGGAVLRRILGSPQSKRFLDTMTPDDMADAQRALDRLADDVEKSTGTRPEFSFGQAAQEAKVAERDVRAVRSLEDKMAEESIELQAVEQSQREAREILERSAFGEFPEEAIGSPQLAEEVSEIATRQISAEREAIERETTQILEEATDKVNQSFNNPDILSSVDNIRNTMSEARRGTFSKLGDEYKKFWAEHPDAVVDLTPLKKTATEWQAITKSDIFQSLTPEDKAIIQDVIAFEGQPTMDTISRALSLLKSERRMMDNLADKPKIQDKRLLNDMINSLEGIRKTALDDMSPDAADALKALDRQYRQASDSINTAMINRILVKDAQGGWKVPDKNTISYLLGGEGRAAMELKNMVESPDFAGFGSLQSVKDGAMALYERDVVNGTMKHDTFMNKYGSGLRNIFTEKEMSPFRTAGRAAKEIKAAQARQTQLVDELKSKFDYTLEKFDGDNLVKIIGASDAPVRRTRELMRVLKDHPDQLNAYKGYRGRQLRNDVSALDDMGNRVFDPNKLQDVIQEQGEELAVLYGKQYVNDLRLFQKLAQTMRVPNLSWTQEMKQIFAENPPMTASVMAIRSTVARPLSRAGLMLTGVRKITSKKARQATAKLLADPKKMEEAMKLYRRDASTKRWAEFLTVMGLDEMANELRE